jgi:hypothetical protein
MLLHTGDAAQVHLCDPAAACMCLQPMFLQCSKGRSHAKSTAVHVRMTHAPCRVHGTVHDQLTTLRLRRKAESTILAATLPGAPTPSMLTWGMHHKRKLWAFQALNHVLDNLLDMPAEAPVLELPQAKLLGQPLTGVPAAREKPWMYCWKRICCAGGQKLVRDLGLGVVHVAPCYPGARGCTASDTHTPLHLQDTSSVSAPSSVRHTGHRPSHAAQQCTQHSPLLQADEHVTTIIVQSCQEARDSSPHQAAIVSVIVAHFKEMMYMK